jgi:hypothetical protein
MHGHESDPLHAFFDEWLLGDLALLGQLLEVLDEPAEGEPTGALEISGELQQSQHIREHLIPCSPKGEASLRPGLVQQLADR